MEALENVRIGLRTRTIANRYKLRNYTGQGLMTRGQGILRAINIRIHTAKLHYRYLRAALLCIWGHGGWEEKLRVLADEDVRALNKHALTNKEKAQNEHWAEIGGAIIEGGIARGAGVAYYARASPTLSGSVRTRPASSGSLRPPSGSSDPTSLPSGRVIRTLARVRITCCCVRPWSLTHALGVFTQ
ncbi:hypothetical protein K438DRAFT_1967645 [Mycena galopus ATCC 62051]|nr:hypothetical protein K438DRAFT_1967645 [Mycena galopus ATCC 62051]